MKRFYLHNDALMSVRYRRTSPNARPTIYKRSGVAHRYTSGWRENTAPSGE